MIAFVYGWVDIRQRYEELSPVLDERGRLAAAETRAYGYGGVSVVSQFTGMAAARLVVAWKKLSRTSRLRLGGYASLGLDARTNAHRIPPCYRISNGWWNRQRGAIRACWNSLSCHDPDAGRPTDTETPNHHTSVPRSCANCRAPSCSRTTTPAPSSPARRLGPPVASLIRGIDRAEIGRLHHVHQKPRQMLFPVANLAAKEPTATPGSDRRSKISFPCPSS